jgi:hypothetical protein
VVDCGTASSILNGKATSGYGTTYNSTATYTCDTGYSFSSLATTRTCQADGTWSAAPVCSIQRIDLKITKIGTGTGVVTSTDGGISCGNTCVATYDYGTTVYLSAKADANQSFTGWSGAGCSGVGSCQVKITGGTTITANFSPPPNVVFVTSTTYTSNLGGLAGADAKCNQRAAAAKLSGKYVAWLSTETVDAISRLGNASGWVRPDGKPVVNTIADIVAGKLLYPPRVDEYGNDVGGEQVAMTATSWNGTKFTNSVNTGYTNCGDFTSDVTPDPPINGFTPLMEDGDPSGASSLFSFSGTIACGQQARLYCFATDRQAQVVPTPVQGRYAFVTKSPWSPGGGIASADSQCQADARAANLPGTYSALLAQTGPGKSASSRFNFAAGSLPWVRPDGIPLAQTAAGVMTGSGTTGLWDTSPYLVADGQALGTSGLLWSGAVSPMTEGSDASTCNSWTTASAGATATAGVIGETEPARLFAEDVASAKCSENWGYVLCLQN